MNAYQFTWIQPLPSLLIASLRYTQQCESDSGASAALSRFFAKHFLVHIWKSAARSNVCSLFQIWYQLNCAVTSRTAVSPFAKKSSRLRHQPLSHLSHFCNTHCLYPHYCCPLSFLYNFCNKITFTNLSILRYFLLSSPAHTHTHTVYALRRRKRRINFPCRFLSDVRTTGICLTSLFQLIKADKFHGSLKRSAGALQQSTICCYWGRWRPSHKHIGCTAGSLQLAALTALQKGRRGETTWT